MKSYKDLIVWQKSMSLASELYKITRCSPKDEIYGLTSQIRRSAVSIPSNIAEGWGQQSRGDYIHFLKVAQGSAAELETEMILSAEIGLLPLNTLKRIQADLTEKRKMLYCLIRSLRADSNSARNKRSTDK